MMKELILKMANDYNKYAELVALNYQQMKEGECDESALQWNRGYKQCIEDYLKEIADRTGAKLLWECNEHEFGFDYWKRTLEYRTVSVDFTNFKDE